jgi:hypothetical protein
MTILQVFLQRACQELRLKIIISFRLLVRDGIEIRTQALLPQLGASKGMIVVNHYDELRGIASELSSMGYGYSVIDEPLSHEEFELEDYVETFHDWGWGNVNDGKPEWIRMNKKDDMEPG